MTTLKQAGLACLTLLFGCLAVLPADAQRCAAVRLPGGGFGDCNSGGGGEGGGTTYYYVAPPPPAGPSPAEIAAQRRRAAAYAANERGIGAVNRKEWVSAVRHYREALTHTPNDRVIQNNLNSALAAIENDKGIEADSVEDYARAVIAYEAAHQLDPPNRFIRINLLEAKGRLAAKNGDVAAAQRYFDEAMALGTPNSESLRYELGQAENRVQNNRHESAIKPEVVSRVKNLLADIQSSNLNEGFSGSGTPSASVAPSGGLNFATGNLSSPPPTNDPNVVDLRQSSSTTVSIAVTRPESPTVDGVTTLHAKRQHEPLTNPLREPKRYRQFLQEERKRYPHLAPQIAVHLEKLEADWAAQRQRTEAKQRLNESMWGQHDKTLERLDQLTNNMDSNQRAETVSRYIQRRVSLESAAERKFHTSLERELAPLFPGAGVMTSEELFRKATSDSALTQAIHARSQNSFAELQKERAEAAEEALKAASEPQSRSLLNFAR
jgi:tetratricopeptide (TPR) repeat protein